MIVVGYLLVGFILGVVTSIFYMLWMTRDSQVMHRRDLRSLQKQEAIRRAAAGRSGRGPR